MSKLRSQAEESPTVRRRWLWELIQNAKDVHYNGGVRIEVEWIDFLERLAFKHSGRPFTADNIRFLIEQISTKDRKKDDFGKRLATGQFGTGFLTTHLLSERVTVTGVAKEPELDYKQFKFDLDRSGFDLETIRAAVEEAKQSVQNLDDLPAYEDYEPNALNTTFEYTVCDDLGKRVVHEGLTDLNRCLPYSLVFVPEIRDVNVCSEQRTYKRIEEATAGSSAFPQVSISDQTTGQTLFTVVTEEESFTVVSMPVEIADGQVCLLELGQEIPRLFCDFPLVGTECFPFPAVINDPHFGPTEPRDGVFLTVGQRQNPVADSNRHIITRAVELLLRLLNRAVAEGWGGARAKMKRNN